MSASFLIELDTAAPVLTFGAATSEPEAGFDLQIAYALDEGTVTSARLAHGALGLPMRVDAGTLTLSLPSDWPDGEATVTAFVVDDVGNAASYAMALRISGVIGPTPTPTPPPAPAPMPAPGFGGGPPSTPLRLRQRSRVGARSGVRVDRRHPVVRTRAVVASASRQSVRRADHSPVGATTALRGTARHAALAEVAVRSSTVIRRRDDPSDEQALLVLDVL